MSRPEGEQNGFPKIHLKKLRSGQRILPRRQCRAKDARYRFKTPDSVDELITMAKVWQAKKAAAGFAGIIQPKEYGGRGGTAMERVIYDQEEANYITPIGVYEIGLGMCIPTMLTYATEEQKQRYAPPAFRGEEIWCQLFSEPQAGSDLANLRLRAERDGDDWILNGQKIWTSGAHFLRYGVIVTRSDPTVAKHKGLTYFFLDMKSPGVECQPIRKSPARRISTKCSSLMCVCRIANGLAGLATVGGFPSRR